MAASKRGEANARGARQAPPDNGSEGVIVATTDTRRRPRRPTTGQAGGASASTRAPEGNAGTVAARALVAGRHSRDGWSDVGGLGGAVQIIAPPQDAEYTWRVLDLDSQALAKVNPARLLELLAEVSPEISRALWDFHRLCNPGREIKAFRIGTEDEHPEAAAEIDAIMRRLRDRHGAADIPINRLFTNAFLRGAMAAEGVIDADGETMVDLATPDAATIRFRRRRDPILGTIWEPGQWQDGQFVPLTRPTFKYIPVDPMPGSPYGRAVATPALFPSLFLLGLLHDLRRVIAQQGYPRIDVAVKMEAILGAMPDQSRADPNMQKQWVDAAIDEVEEAMKALEPDDTYVHTDVIEVNKPVGTIDSSSLGAVEGIIKGLERMIARALKTMPLMMGSTEGASEANANRQWEVQAAGVKSIQHLAENLLGALLEIALQAKGIIATVEARFAELRAAEMMRDAQTERLQIANARAKYQAGWIDQDMASMEITGHPAAETEPRALPGGEATPGGGGAGDSLNENPEPGSDRSSPQARQARRRRAAARLVAVLRTAGAVAIAEARGVIPAGAADPLGDVPDAVEFTEADIEAVLASWDAAMPEFAGLLDAEVINDG